MRSCSRRTTKLQTVGRGRKASGEGDDGGERAEPGAYGRAWAVSGAVLASSTTLLCLAQRQCTLSRFRRCQNRAFAPDRIRQGLARRCRHQGKNALRQPGCEAVVQYAVRKRGFADPWFAPVRALITSDRRLRNRGWAPLQLLAAGNCRPHDGRPPRQDGLGIVSGCEERSGLEGGCGRAMPSALRRCEAWRSPYQLQSSGAPPRRRSPAPVTHETSYPSMSFDAGAVVQSWRRFHVAPRCHWQPIPDCPTVRSNRQLSRCSSRWRRRQGLRRVGDVEGGPTIISKPSDGNRYLVLFWVTVPFFRFAEMRREHALCGGRRGRWYGWCIKHRIIMHRIITVQSAP